MSENLTQTSIETGEKHESTTPLLYTSEIEAKTGEIFRQQLFVLDTPLGSLPESSPLHFNTEGILDVAYASFTNWNETAQQKFKDVILPGTKTFSVIKNIENDVIGFNLYTRGEVPSSRIHPTYLYVNYVGIDPSVDEKGKARYRNKGLMQKSWIEDLVHLDADVLSACSAVGELYKGVESVAESTGRVLYPNANGDPVPSRIGELGHTIYSQVNGPSSASSLDQSTLVRLGASAYLRGNIHHPLISDLHENAGRVFLAIKKDTADKILTEK